MFLDKCAAAEYNIKVFSILCTEKGIISDMKFIYRLFRQDPDTREGVIATTSALGIAVNLIIAAVKVIAGLLASSIAIVSEGVNNATDALTSVITLIGTKLAGKHPDEKHPFGYGRIEYLTGLVIAVLILVTGIEMLISSVKLIFEPSELDITFVSLAVVALSAVIKFFLGLYTIRMGKKADSSALEAVGLDSYVGFMHRDRPGRKSLALDLMEELRPCFAD